MNELGLEAMAIVVLQLLGGIFLLLSGISRIVRVASLEAVQCIDESIQWIAHDSVAQWMRDDDVANVH
jgi:hypothetical protein